MKRLALSLTATLALVPAIACSGAREAGGGGDGGLPSDPPRTCANDTACGSAAACVGNRCVDRRSDIDTWAIEIAPPRGSGAQLTEWPAAGTVQPVLTVSPETTLALSFHNMMSPGVTVPTSASVILSAPSAIPGRLPQSFQANLGPSGSAELLFPRTLSGQDALVRVIPLSPSDQGSPPYVLPFMIPSDAATAAIPLPPNPFTIRGLLRNSLDEPKNQYTARVFEPDALVTNLADRDILVSTIGKITAADPGRFVVVLPGGARNDLTLELVPDNTSDPVVTLTGLSIAQTNTDLGVIALPAYAAPTQFRVTVQGQDQTLVAGATVRAHTTFSGAGGTGVIIGPGAAGATGSGGAAGGFIGGTGGTGSPGRGGTTGTGGVTGTGGSTGAAQVTTQFFRDGLTDAGGIANLSLIPGTTREQRYTLSIVPAAGSPWASQCIPDVPVGYDGPAAPGVATRDVTLTRRPVLSGTVTSHSGMPVAGVVVTATSAAARVPPCLAGPATTSTTTNPGGTFTLPLDPGNYQLEFAPPAGSPFPRLTVLTTPIQSGQAMQVRLPEPAVVEGFVRDADGALPDATVRIFQPRCDQVDPCTTPPVLHAETQTDAAGRFRAIVPKGTGTN